MIFSEKVQIEAFTEQKNREVPLFVWLKRGFSWAGPNFRS